MPRTRTDIEGLLIRRCAVAGAGSLVPVHDRGRESIESGIGTSSPASVSQRECARIARFSILPAFIPDNATGMRTDAFPDAVFPRSVIETRESGLRIPFPGLEMYQERSGLTVFCSFYPRRGRKCIRSGPSSFTDSSGGQPGGAP